MQVLNSRSSEQKWLQCVGASTQAQALIQATAVEVARAISAQSPHAVAAATSPPGLSMPNGLAEAVVDAARTAAQEACAAMWDMRAHQASDATPAVAAAAIDGNAVVEALERS